MKTLESTRTNNIIKYLNSHKRCLVRKRYQDGMSVQGDPDITGCVAGGIHIELEVKQPGNYPTKIQKLRMLEWETAGAIVACVHDVNEVKALLELHNIKLDPK